MKFNLNDFALYKTHITHTKTKKKLLKKKDITLTYEFSGIQVENDLGISSDVNFFPEFIKIMKNG